MKLTVVFDARSLSAGRWASKAPPCCSRFTTLSINRLEKMKLDELKEKSRLAQRVYWLPALVIGKGWGWLWGGVIATAVGVGLGVDYWLYDAAGVITAYLLSFACVSIICLLYMLKGSWFETDDKGRKALAALFIKDKPVGLKFLMQQFVESFKRCFPVQHVSGSAVEQMLNLADAVTADLTEIRAFGEELRAARQHIQIRVQGFMRQAHTPIPRKHRLQTPRNLRRRPAPAQALKYPAPQTGVLVQPAPTATAPPLGRLALRARRPITPYRHTIAPHLTTQGGWRTLQLARNLPVTPAP